MSGSGQCPPPVLIVGGGIAGATLAIALARQGIECEVAEIQDDWRPVGVGLTLLGPALRALKTIDLIEGAVASGNGIYRLAIGNAESEITHTAELPRLNGPEYPSAIQISRPAFHRLLADEVRARRIPVRTGLTVTSLSPNGSNVETKLTDGTRADYSLVVGADGVHSRVRQLLLGDEVAPRFTGQAVWRAMVPRPKTTGTEYEEGTLHMFYGPRNKAGMLPVSAHEMYVFLVQNVSERLRPPESELPGLLREQLSDYTGLLGELRDRITEPDQVVYRSLEVVLVPPPWHRGSVLLIGDAAHATTPHLAHGGGLAIEDAVVLAELLGSGAALPAVLERFMARRWERCRMVVENSVQLGAWEQHPSPDADPASLTNASWLALADPI